MSVREQRPLEVFKGPNLPFTMNLKLVTRRMAICLGSSLSKAVPHEEPLW